LNGDLSNIAFGMAASISQQLSNIEEQVDGALAKVQADPGASPALKAVVEELHEKTREARDGTRGADQQTIRDHIIIAEEAADSAKRAAEAESQISEASREAVLNAHNALSELKSVLP
jgi:hypothetical protein